MNTSIEPNDTSADALPAVLTGAQITEARLQEIESWGKYVVADPLDEVGAKEADRLRLLAKSDRCTAVRICDHERDDAMRQNKWWIAIKKRVADRIEAVENHLQSIVDAHKAAVAAKKQAKTQARLDALSSRGIAPNLVQAQTLTDEAWDKWIALETEQAAIRARAQDVADRLTALGDPCVYVEAIELSEQQQKARLAAAALADLLRKNAEKLAKELTELGDPCTTEEALVLPEEAATQRLRDAREDKERRDEEARIELGKRRVNELVGIDIDLLLGPAPMPIADELAALNQGDWAEKVASIRRTVEERARARLQLGADRLRILAEMGMESLPTQDHLSIMEEVDFERIRGMAEDAKAVRDESSRQAREELETLRKEKADRGELRARVIADASAGAPAGTHLQSWSEDYLANLTEAAFQDLVESVRTTRDQAVEAERVRVETETRRQEEREAKARPEREKLAAWVRDFMAAMPPIPEVTDPQLVGLLTRTTTQIETALRLMRGAMEV